MTNDYLDALVQEKKRFSALTEVFDLTTQLASALDREDQTSFSLVLTMRQEPLLLLQEIERNLAQVQSGASEENRARLASLLRGHPAEQAGELPLAEQIAQNRRLLTRILDLDRRISLKLGGEDSFYCG